MTRPFKTVIIETLETLQAIIPAWWALWRVSEYATAFNNPSFCVPWLSAATAVAHIEPHLVSVWRDAELVGLAALYRKNDGTVTAIGGGELADYHDWLIAACHRPERVVGTILLALCRHSTSTLLALHRVRDQQAQVFRICLGDGAVKPAGSRRYSKDLSCCNASAGSLLDTASRRYMLDTLRCRRRLKEQVKHRFTWHHTAGAACVDVLQFIIQAKREQYIRTHAPDLTSLPGYSSFMHGLLGEMNRSGLLCVTSIALDNGVLIAAHIGMLTTDTVTWYLPAYDRQFKRYSPGRLLLLCTAAEAVTRGYAELDFTWGDDPYKTQWSTSVEELWCVRMQGRCDVVLGHRLGRST